MNCFMSKLLSVLLGSAHFVGLNNINLILLIVPLIKVLKANIKG